MHHVDDFSTTDLRHTLAEAWRIACDRRWWFIFTFGVVSVAAFSASHWLPRKYSAKTVFERRNDVVLQSLIGDDWSQAFEAQRRSTSFDLKGPEALSEVFDRGDFDKLVAVKSLSKEEAQRSVEDWFTALAQRVEVKIVESTPQRDVIEVRMDDHDPRVAAETIVILRDHYIEQSNRRMMSLLADSLAYFQAEADRVRELIRAGQHRLSDMEREYPAVRPDYNATASVEINSLLFEKAELRRRLADQQDTVHRMRRLLGEGGKEPVDGAAVDITIENPDRPRIAAEMERIQKTIRDERTLRGKTNEHPDIELMLHRLSQLEAQYNGMPARIAVGSGDATNLSVHDVERQRDWRSALDTALSQIAAAEERIDAVNRRLTEIESHKSAAIDLRASHNSVMDEVKGYQAELATWQSHIDPIQRILDAQTRDRGVRFVSVKEPNAITRPTSPNSRVVLLACLMIGLAGGGLAVLMLELFDRSFRTAAQVTRSLSVPVLETIDEIITPALRRKRLVTHLVVLPVIMVVMLSVVGTTALAAYLSLEMPWVYERFRAHPLRIFGRADADDRSDDETIKTPAHADARTAPAVTILGVRELAAANNRNATPSTLSE